MRHFLIRIFNMIFGIFLHAVGIVITIKANIGYSPWDVLHSGIALKTGFSMGIASILTGLIIVIIVSILKEKLGVGTIANMVLIGLFIDLTFPYIPVTENTIIGIIMLITGLFIISVGSYLYLKSAFGAGPRDSLMVLVTRKTKLPVGLCRGAIELVVTLTGWLLGGLVGFGTAIFVVAIGFCIQIVFRLFRFDVAALKQETLIDTYATIRSLRNT